MNPPTDRAPAGEGRPTMEGGCRRAAVRAWGRLRRQGLLGVAIAAAAVALAGFVVFPIAEIVARSLGPGGRHQWRRLLEADATPATIGHTLVLGVLVGVIGTMIGLMVALVQVRTGFRAKRLLHAVMLIPVISPPFAVAMSVITLFGRSGLITHEWLGLRHDITGLDGLLLATSISFMPIAYLNFVGMLRAFDGALEDAATDLGSGMVRRFRTVVLPLLGPGIANSFLLLFVSAIADLGNAVLLAGDHDVLASRIYLAVIGEFDLDKAAVYSVMLLFPSMVVFGAQHLWLRRKEFITVTGRAHSATRPIQPRWLSGSLCTLAVAVAVLIVVIYGYIVVGAFTRVWNIDFTPTFDHLAYVVRGAGREALVDTLLLAALSTPIATSAGLLIAFVVTQRRFPGRRLLDFASVLGVAVPGTIIGIGLLLAYRQPRLGGLVPELTGTGAVLVLAFTVRALPGVVRVAAGAFDQLSGSLEEASTSLGATPTQTFGRIILPLIRPAVFTSLVWSFARSMTSLSPIVFLLTPEWRIMTAEILNAADQGRFGSAAAHSVVLVSVVLAAISLLSSATGFRLSQGPARRRRSRRALAPPSLDLALPGVTR